MLKFKGWRSDVISRILFMSIVSLPVGQSAMADDLDDPEIQFKIAENMSSAGDQATAIGLYRDYLSNGGDIAKGYLGLGMAMLKGGSPSKAITAFTKVLEVDPENVKALCGKGQSIMSLNNHAEASALFAQALRYNSKAFCALNGYAVTYNLMGQHKKAIGLFETALKIYPDQKTLLSNLGLALALSGETKEAIQKLMPFALDEDATPRDRQNLALAYGLDGQMEKASRYFAMDLEKSDVQRNLGFVTLVRNARADSNAVASLYKPGSVQNPKTTKVSQKVEPPIQVETFDEAAITAN